MGEELTTSHMKFDTRAAYSSTYLVDGGTGASLAERVLSVVKVLRLGDARLPHGILRQRVRHRDAQSVAPDVRVAVLLVSMGARLSSEEHPDTVT